METTNASQVALLRERIALEYQASQRALHGFSVTAKHEYITKRQENIGACFEELRKLLPAEEAITIVVETLNGLQSTGSLSGKTS